MRWFVVAATLALVLSGCASSKTDNSSTGGVTSETGTTMGAAGANRAPVITSLSANATALKALFTLNATDADRDNLTFVLAFGDASANQTGKLPASAVNHTYAKAGNYTARLVVTDGKDAAVRTLNLTVLAGGATAPKQEDASFAGSVSCLPTFVLPGGIEDGSHTLTVLPGQTKLTLTLTYDEMTGIEDMDFTVTDPGGKVTESAESGPEPPLDFSNPAAGDWVLDVIAYSCVASADYTVTAVFG